MRTIRLLVLLVLLGLAGPHSVAQDPATPAPSPGQSGTTGEEIDTFEPSEKVPADTAVAFPVDI